MSKPTRECISPRIQFDGNFTKTEAQQRHHALTFDELQRWAKLKRRLKHGPKMTSGQRVDYLRRLARAAGLAK